MRGVSRRQPWRRATIGLGLGAMCATVAACGASGAGSSALTIGIFHAYSGPNAAYGPEAAAGCYPAVKLINAAGGVLGHTLQCKPYDSKGDPADAVPAANELIATTPSLVGVLGGGTSTATAVVPIFNSAHIPVFSTTGQSSFDATTDAYFWRILSPDAAQGSAMAAAAKRLGFTRIATVFGNDSSAQGSAPAAIAGVRALGLDLVANQTLAIDQASYSSQVQQLIAARPQVIISEADPQTSATYLSELKQLGNLVPMITDPVSQEPPWIQAVSGVIGKADLQRLDYIVTVYSSPNTPAYAEYTKALMSSKAQVPQPGQWDSDLYSVSDYDSVNIMALAMIASHSTKPSVFNKWIMKVTSPSPGAEVVHTFAAGKAALDQGKAIQYVGAVGPTVFNQYHNSGQSFGIERNHSGNFVLSILLTPAEVNAAAGQ